MLSIIDRGMDASGAALLHSTTIPKGVSIAPRLRATRDFAPSLLQLFSMVLELTITVAVRVILSMMPSRDSLEFLFTVSCKLRDLHF